ncbi:TLDc domain-containing protein [Entamoeba marina]
MQYSSINTSPFYRDIKNLKKSLLIGNNYNDCTANIQTLIDLFENGLLLYCLHLHSKNSTINFLVNNTISIDFRNFLLQYFDITENDLHQYAMKINQEQNQINIQTIISKINQISNDELITFLQINKGTQNETIIDSTKQLLIKNTYYQTWIDLNLLQFKKDIKQFKLTCTSLNLKGTGVQLKLSNELNEMNIFKHLNILEKWSKKSKATLIFDSKVDNYSNLFPTIKSKKNLMFLIQTNNDNVFGTYHSIEITQMNQNIDSKNNSYFVTIGCCTLIISNDNIDGNTVGAIDNNFNKYYKDTNNYTGLIFDNSIHPNTFITQN